VVSPIGQARIEHRCLKRGSSYKSFAKVPVLYQNARAESNVSYAAARAGGAIATGRAGPVAAG